MALSHYVQERLYNWKFASAHIAVQSQGEQATEKEAELIESLAMTFGDPGWFEGHMAIVIEIALEHIGIVDQQL